MLAIADKQRRNGTRKKAPIFFAPVMSHTGEFSKDLFKLVNLLAARAKERCVKVPSLDGIPPERVSAEFRTRLKDALAACNARGVADALNDAGIPKTGRINMNRVEPDDAQY